MTSYMLRMQRRCLISENKQLSLDFQEKIGGFIMLKSRVAVNKMPTNEKYNRDILKHLKKIKNVPKMC